MKKFVSVFLSFLMLLCCVIPVSATGLDSNTNGYSFDALPYLNPIYLDISNLSSYSFTFTLPSITDTVYIEGSFTSDDINPSLSSQFSNFTVTNVVGNLFHFYGVLDPYKNYTHRFTFTKGGSGTFINFLTLEITPMFYIKSDLTFNVNFQGSYTYREYNDPFSDQPFTNKSTSFNETDSISGVTYARPPLLQQNTNTSDYQYNEQRVYVTTYIYFDWTKFDRVDMFLWNGYDSITECLFYVDGVSVLKNCYPNISPTSASMVSLDFTSLDPNINSHLCYIRFRGYKELDSTTLKNLIQIPKVSAFVTTVSNNFWPSWLNQIINKLDNIFTGRAQDQVGADSFNDSINDQADELEDLTADLNSVTRPPLSDVNLSTSGMVDQSVVVLATNGIGSILSNQIILRVLIMSLTFALAGFILFGKR